MILIIVCFDLALFYLVLYSMLLVMESIGKGSASYVRTLRYKEGSTYGCTYGLPDPNQRVG
jgi:hypothetical protein